MKYLLITLLFMTSFTAVQAQSEVEISEKAFKKIAWKFSGNFSAGFGSIKGKSESYSGSVPSFGAGIDLPVRILPDKTELIAGLGYSMQGSKYEEHRYVPGGREEAIEGTVRLGYLIAPLTARHTWNNGFYGEAGLQPALLLGAKDKFQGETKDLKDSYNSFDLGFIAGAGYEIKKKFSVGIRVVPGLTNINKSVESYQPPKDRNMVISLRASCKF